ncbi:MAG: hypothetical protein PHW13_04605, partial [Methylococcales bacterium]|nr:hypothetical protein [Methylococcales bacterium]
SEVKPLSADDSVAGCHVKVGHRQALKSKPGMDKPAGLFFARATPIKACALQRQDAFQVE